MSVMPRQRLILVLMSGVLAVSLAPIFIRLAQAPGVVIAFYRMLIASLVLLPVSLPALRSASLSIRSVSYASLAGIFLGAHFATWISSFSFTTVAASTTLVATNPLWIVLFSWLLWNRPPSRRTLVGVIIAVVGSVLIGYGDLSGGPAPLLGDALALLGAVCSAAYLMLGQAAQKQGLSLQAYIGLAYGTAALVLLPLPALFGFSYRAYDAPTWLWIVLIALIPQLIGHTSLNYALKHVGATLVSLVILLEPIGSSLLALALFSELPSALSLLGALILLAGVALTVFSRAKPN